MSTVKTNNSTLGNTGNGGSSNDDTKVSDGAVLLTQEGLDTLIQELQYLKTTKRREVAERLKEAISYGDLSENSEYEDAKNEQAFVEGRIVELEKMIKNARIIDDQKAHSGKTVQIGTTVTIQNITREEEPEEFTIVGSTEADPLRARISNESPIGMAVLGRKKGEIVDVEAPAGVSKFEILELK
jgi:transcription elongation factor GreA